MALLVPVFSIGLSPQPTLLDLRQDVPLKLPANLQAGDVVVIPFTEPQQILMDGKTSSQLPDGLVLLAPQEKSFGGYANIYYRRYEDNRLLWWSRAIPVEVESQKRVLRLPASLPKATLEDNYKDLLKQFSSQVNGKLRSPCFRKPIESLVTSKFGEPRVLPNGKFYHHAGVDQRAWLGNKVRAVSDGVVLYADSTSVTGQMIIIDHGGGMNSRYMHLSKFKVSTGEIVKKGQIIGLSGNSGRSLAPHLHWELSWKGASLDPLNFLQKMAPICDQG